MRFSAVFFDFDGTLIDSYAAIAASVNHVRGRHGLPALPVEEVKRYVGRGPEHLFGHTVPGSDVEKNLAIYRAHHPTIMAGLTQLLPGAAETIERLDAAGISLGLCSNKPRLFSQGLLEHLGIAERFRVVLGPEDVPHLKPAPDMLRLALERLKLRAAEALYVGDMTVDIETARAAGVTVWIVPTGSDRRDVLAAARPDRLLDGLAAVVDGVLGSNR
jgi:phosphoglycolate phosphatase